MAVAPALPWRATSGEVLRRRLLVPAYIGVATMIVTLLFGAHGIAQVVSFGLGSFALAGIGRNLFLSVRTRRKAYPEAPPTAVVNTVRGNPRLYGGLIVHAGVVVIAIALGVSSGYATRREVSLQRGESATVAGYRVTVPRVDTRRRPQQKTTISARVRLCQGSRRLGVYEPGDLVVPERRRRDRHPVGAHRHPPRRVPHARVEPDSRPGHARRRRQSARDLAVDRRAR